MYSSVENVGLLFAGYISGPAGNPITIPVGSCIFVDAKKGIFLTATHVLEELTKVTFNEPEIKPKFDKLLVGLRCDPEGVQLFSVADKVEISPEVTALYVSKISTDKKPLPSEIPFKISPKRVTQFFPVWLVGYPASIQKVSLKPDDDNMELRHENTHVFSYCVSGCVSQYYNNSAPYFVPQKILPAFMVDNAALPGMSGGAVMLNIPHQHDVVGMIVKNIEVTDRAGYRVIHTLSVCLTDLTY